MQTKSQFHWLLNKSGVGVFKVGQLARSKQKGKVIQIRRIKIKDGFEMLGGGRKSFAWVFAKDYEKYRKVEK